MVGHSQGGGAAWAVAQRQAIKPVTGYLGAVAISPVTRIIDDTGPFLTILGTAICPGLAAAFPEFRLDHVLTPDGENRIKAIIQSGGGVASSIALLSGGELVKPTWKEDPYIQKYQSLISNGGKEIGGPLLVIHGECDARVSTHVTTSAVDKTADLFPSSQLQYVLLPHVTHNPALSASQRLWMDWIGDRFAGREVESRRLRSNLVPARPGEAYQEELNWYITPATQFFHAP